MPTVEVQNPDGTWSRHNEWRRIEFAHDVARRLRDMGIFQGERVGLNARVAVPIAAQLNR